MLLHHVAQLPEPTPLIFSRLLQMQRLEQLRSRHRAMADEAQRRVQQLGKQQAAQEVRELLRSQQLGDAAREQAGQRPARSPREKK